uniref:Uncharacterized protein n=1 Tax=Ditylenchus dipsaci TaxID=166011 RepID=A0A915D311_9BILA
MAKAAKKKVDAAGDSDLQESDQEGEEVERSPKRAMQCCSGPEVMKAAWRRMEDCRGKSKWEKLAADDKKRFQDESAS